MEGGEIPEILKIPRPLQDKFFNAAEGEADRLLKRVGEIDKLIKRLSDEVARGISPIRLRSDWRDMTIAVVDGSDTPAIDERIGVRFGLYAAAYKLFKGEDPLENGEGYLGDRLNEQIRVGKETFLKVLDLVTTYLERMLAEHLLKQNTPHVDLLILDGSFLGYRTGCSLVKGEQIDLTEPVTGKHFRTIYDLISEINDLTLKIAKSGRAVGVIKRVPTEAIEGYIRYRYGEGEGLNLSDRALLSLVMSQGEVFSYEKYFGSRFRIDALSWYRTVSRDPKVRGKSRDEILKEAERRVKVQLKADLTAPASQKGKGKVSHEGILELADRLSRFFVLTREGLPPICVEVPNSVLVSENLLDNVLSYCLETSSPVTGLPKSLDLVDELVSLPRGLGKDFVTEVEARLLMRGVDSRRLIALFSRFNPQKDEY